MNHTSNPLNELHPDFEACIVKTYSGYTYAQRPESFVRQGAEYKVQSVEAEWIEPGGRHLRVRTAQGPLFELCYREKQDAWFLKQV